MYNSACGKFLINHMQINKNISILLSSGNYRAGSHDLAILFCFTQKGTPVKIIIINNDK